MPDNSVLFCARCGSLRTRPIKAGPLARAIAALCGQRVIVCGRCGWRGRQRPVRDRRTSMRLDGATVAADPHADRTDLATLDRMFTPDDDRRKAEGR